MPRAYTISKAKKLKPNVQAKLAKGLFIIKKKNDPVGPALGKAFANKNLQKLCLDPSFWSFA